MSIGAGFGSHPDSLATIAAVAVGLALAVVYPEAGNIAAICGKGANGGDGRIALRLLAEAGRETSEAPAADADVVALLASEDARAG